MYSKLLLLHRYLGIAAGRGYRWWFSALHRGDFAAVVRARPVWDVVVLVLLLGVTVNAVTGTLLGPRRLLSEGRNGLPAAAAARSAMVSPAPEKPAGIDK